MSNNITKNNVSLNWQDVLWGYEHHFLEWQEVVNYANDKVTNESNYDESIIELSMINETTIFNIESLLKKIVKVDHCYSTEKWLYIILLDLFNKQKELDDPLGRVEEIYENFDYPEEIESFVRYMPVSDDYDPSKHTNDENINRLYSNWENYLINKGSTFTK
ncbi:DUF2247 family protein [Snodgrassella sp. ESL0253]|uniref:DUF2247 family protein n=1 Tax=Snodgrassella sp. ESL0253 TaxID=2705031 RepID=UPI0015818551|nr:DUF2247 family protein [Snodgrassella sp. ESL0253]NUE67741.1 DUF2247 family protein [Snodgrassella sp. ESL0253]